MFILTERRDRLISVALMWRCGNCGNAVEDKYAHCWQCGAPNAVKRTKQNPQASPTAVPGFASYEELAKVPSRPIWIFRRGPLQRLVGIVGIVTIFKILSARFIGRYGLYIAAAVALVSLIVLLWRFFRRDPTEGVGIKLN